jgi:hypothetical protein
MTFVVVPPRTRIALPVAHIAAFRLRTIPASVKTSTPLLFAPPARRRAITFLCDVLYTATPRSPTIGLVFRFFATTPIDVQAPGVVIEPRAIAREAAHFRILGRRVAVVSAALISGTSYDRYSKDNHRRENHA